jgi:predicted dehydrogenase
LYTCKIFKYRNQNITKTYLTMKIISRRGFLQTSIIGAVGLSVLPLIKSCAAASANDTIRLGFIGLGQQAMGLMNGFLSIPGVQIVAGADVYGVKCTRFEQRLKKHYSDIGINVDVATYKNYKELLDRQDIDAVVIATPDHWHALNAIDACKAGKDVYLEKPLTWTIKEGIEVVNAVRNNNRILAVGSQQRSDFNFYHAARLAREGKLGKLEKIYAYVGDFPSPYNLPEMALPGDLDWEMWLGPNPYVHYNERLAPAISLDPVQNERGWAEWRYFKETGGGFITDWGAHNFDIAQWGLGADDGGPVEIIPPGHNGAEYLTYMYANGVPVTNQPYDEKSSRGIKFWGENGWVEVARGYYNASDDSLRPTDEQKADEGVPYETGVPHLENFITSMRDRKDPIVPVEIGHRTGTTCILGNIANELGRPVKWDPAAQYFVNDPEAEKFYHREYRSGYSL